MLEEWIVRTYRRARDARRERRAAPFDAEARRWDQLATFYEKCGKAFKILNAPTSSRADVLVSQAEAQVKRDTARRRAADIRAGRR